jgi:hypothetical protein
MKDILSEIISRVRAELKTQADTVTAGTNVNTFPDYRHYIGKIEGLQSALDIIDQILTEDDEENS